jgi:hypothetical protein
MTWVIRMKYRDANSPILFHDKANFGEEKTRFLPQNTVHKCIMVALSSKVLLHPFHVNHSWNDQPFWHFYTHPPMFHEVDQFYLLAAKYPKGQILQRMHFKNGRQEDLFHPKFTLNKLSLHKHLPLLPLFSF